MTWREHFPGYKSSRKPIWAVVPKRQTHRQSGHGGKQQEGGPASTGTPSSEGRLPENTEALYAHKVLDAGPTLGKTTKRPEGSCRCKRPRGKGPASPVGGNLDGGARQPMQVCELSDGAVSRCQGARCEGEGKTAPEAAGHRPSPSSMPEGKPTVWGTGDPTRKGKKRAVQLGPGPWRGRGTGRECRAHGSWAR